MDKDYYAILGVHPSAEEAVISAAYRALAKLYHPDLYKASERCLFLSLLNSVSLLPALLFGCGNVVHIAEVGLQFSVLSASQ